MRIEGASSQPPTASAYAGQRFARALALPFAGYRGQNLAGGGIDQPSADGAHGLGVAGLYSKPAQPARSYSQSTNVSGFVVAAELGDAAHNDGVHSQDLADLCRCGRIGTVTV